MAYSYVAASQLPHIVTSPNLAELLQIVVNAQIGVLNKYAGFIFQPFLHGQIMAE